MHDPTVNAPATRHDSRLVEYLTLVQSRADDSRLGDEYLWPRTPLDDIQSKIRVRVGVDDYSADDSRSRPNLIRRWIDQLIRGDLSRMDFSLLDVACGDAIVLWRLQGAFRQASLFGIDCNTGRIATHERVAEAGVLLYRGFMQDLFRQASPVKFDFVVMLNTYRGWEFADLTQRDRDLPRLADEWLDRNARYVIVTATRRQIARLASRGYSIARLGRGEDGSQMICFSREPMPRRGRLARAFDAVRIALGI